MSIFVGGWLMVLLPAIGVLISTMAYSQRRVGQTVIVCCTLAMVVALVLLAWSQHLPAGGYQSTVNYWNYQPSGTGFVAFARPFQGELGINLDALSLSVCTAITVFSAVILWHASTYLRSDGDYRRLVRVAAGLETTVLAMVAAPNMLQVLMMWLIASALVFVAASHWWQTGDDQTSTSAWTGFTLARIGDAALLLAVVIYFARLAADAIARAGTGGTYVDPLSFSSITAEATAVANLTVLGVGTKTLVAIALLLLIAVAMRLHQGPFVGAALALQRTPLATLIMAGVFLPLAGLVIVARLDGLLFSVRHLESAVAVVAALCALVGALIALVQRDAARAGVAAVAAQFGLAMAALGVGGFSSTMQMGITTIGFGALYFLAIANVARSYRTQLFTEMGGAWKRLPLSSVALGVWVVAVAGLDLVSYNALAGAVRNSFPVAGHVTAWVAVTVAVLTTVTSAVLAAFAVRTWARVCLGEPVWRKGFPAERIKDVEGALRSSLVAMMAVAVVPVVLGIPAVPVTFSHFVFYGPIRQVLNIEPLAVVLALMAGVVGAAAGWLWPRDAAAVEPSRPLVASFGLEALLTGATGLIDRAGSAAVLRADRELFDALAEAAGGALSLGGRAVALARVKRLTLLVAAGLAVAAVVVGALVIVASAHLSGHGA